MRLRTKLFLFLLGGTINSYCLAGGHPLGVCYTTLGAHEYNLNLNGYEVTGEHNEAGYETPEEKLSSSGSYKVRCQCANPGERGNVFYDVYYTARVPSLVPDTTKGNRHYYTINENLSVASSIEVLGRGFIPVPFEAEPNRSDNSGNCDGVDDFTGNPATLVTGSHVKVSFLINKPFIGQVTVPASIVAQLYGGINAEASTRSTEILAKVYIAGDIIVPQTCEVTAGQVINIDFGKIPMNEFSSTQGEAIGSRKITKKVEVQCTGMESENIVYSSFHADSAGSDVSMVGTTNEDVGVAIFDKWGNRVNVNGGAMDMDMDQIGRDGKTAGALNFSAAPASATGRRPEPGTFTADATITLEIKN
ncbi:fimbrial protein [Salmonella enterica]|nr:fimbrial protein StgD [Salmonella enterica subsp. enterica serovar Baguida]EJE9657497.1 fimbrial protein [Salmonella enterica]EJE9775813.1 fimbrial protein [Salmonella enterica]EJF5536136.1 fimbrial protein [Salmonella enterica]EJF5647539.1 fimbrial protein [Salmonella enterica]